MKYNPLSDISSIYNAGNAWQVAPDKKTKDEEQKKAKQYYDNLINNGYADLADTLSKSDSNKRKEILNKFTTLGQTPTREYMYSLGKARGMKTSDIDNLIGWDNTTGEVSFGGKKIGRPDTVVDGVSYWQDTSKLDSAFNDYVKRSGITTPSNVNNPAYNQRMQASADTNDTLKEMVIKDHDKMNDTSYDLYGYANKDVTDTDEYKSAFEKIMPSYTLQALQGYKNEIADGAASNSGNIDSFAEANARRQQAALTAKGQALAHQMGLEAYNARLQNAKSILADLGAYNDRIYSHLENTQKADASLAQQHFDNDQTAKMNDNTIKNDDIENKRKIASITGLQPDEFVASNNPYMNDDGTVKDEYKNVDFAAVMEKAKATGNTKAYNNAALARYYKIMGNYGAYGQFDDGDYIAPVDSPKTQEAYEFDKQIDSADRALGIENEKNIRDNQAKIYVADKEASSALDQIKTAAEYGTATSVDNPSKTSQDGIDLLGGNGNGATSEADYQTKLNDTYDKSSETVKAYIRNELEPLITENSITETELKEHLIANSQRYDLETKDIKAICTALGVDSKWVDNYKNKGLFGWGKGVKER